METNLLDEFIVLLKIIGNRLHTTRYAGSTSKCSKDENREVNAHSFAPLKAWLQTGE